MKRLAIFFICTLLSSTAFAQSFPWQNALMIATSSDGTTFNTPQVFQDSSGVPNVIRLSDGRLMSAFQWFPAPFQGPGWDSVAIKISTDTAATWSAPIHCNFTGMPSNFQRPFDPALSETSTGQIRMYFSTGPMGPTLDSNINTYSAISTDGINYAFEGGIRFDDASLAVIDPTVTTFNGVMHYIAPRGAPQAGAFHATSLDGLTLTPLPNIPSDMVHQWTGNLLADDTSMMRFYGAGGGSIWWSSSADGNTWSFYNPTNINGGDPAVLRLPDSSYIMIYVGLPNPAAVVALSNANPGISFYPNPADDFFNIKMETEGNYTLSVFDTAGRKLIHQAFTGASTSVEVGGFSSGLYFVEVLDVERNIVYREKIMK
jgi:hypothetical protein